MQKSISQKILRNTTFNILARIVHTAAYIVVIPVIIYNVGETRYGIWVTFFAVVDYFSLLDLGFGAATVKYTADYYARNEIFCIGQIVITVFLFNLLFFPLMIIPIFYADNIVNFFHVAPENFNEAIFVLRGVLLIFAFTQMTSVFRNILIGLQRMDIQNLCEMINTLLYAAGVIFVFIIGLGLKELILLIGGLRLFLVVTHILCVLKIFPGIKKGLKHFSARMFKEFFSYGIKLQITSVAGLFNFQLDKLLIGHFLRINLVTFYELGSKIATFIRQVPSVLLIPLIPASAELAVKGDRKRLEDMHLRGAKYLTLTAAPIAVFLIAMAPTIMLVWIGIDDYSYTILALRILSIGYFFNIVAGAVTSIVRGIGIMHYEMYTSLFIALTNLTLSFVLIIKIGFVGALIGTTVSMTVGDICYLYKFNKYMKIPFAHFLKVAFIMPVFAALFAGAIAWLSQYSIYNDIISIPINRMNMAVYLVLTCVFFTLIYSGGLFLSGFIKQSDMEIFQKLIRSFKGKHEK